jgi:hypothetical protein
VGVARDALGHVMLFYPMLDLLRLSLTDATVAGSRYAYTLGELPGADDRHVLSTG